MKEFRLGRIQRELNCKLEEITTFLSANGFEYDNSPKATISEEAKQLLDNNFRSKYISTIDHGKTELPTELKILGAVNKEKLLVERIIGFTDFKWKYLISTYSGECTKPVQFSSFDDVICQILLQNKDLSLENIGKVIGLDTKNDLGAKEIMRNAMVSLTEPNKNGDMMVEGDESAYWLTELGKTYAEKGVKYKTYKRDFEIYWDKIGVDHVNANKSLSKLTSERINDESESNTEHSFEELKKVAEHQSPEIHYPKKGFTLLSAKHKVTETFEAAVWVCFLENFRDNTTRILVYNESQDNVIHELSSILNNDQRLKEELLEKLIISDESVSETNDPKPLEQKQLENVLIEHQLELDTARGDNEVEVASEILKRAESNKIHFNTLEFELELKKLFESTVGDVWIISPWIRRYAFKRRLQFIENYLKKGGRVFISYSKPEQIGQEMVDEYSESKLIEMEKKYTHFYFCELPHFHYKNVWLKNTDVDDIYYSGSFNILSFFVNQNKKYVRQEKMAKLPWDQEIDTEYQKVFYRFGSKYIGDMSETLKALDDSPPKALDQTFINKISSLGNEKLKPFIGADDLDDSIHKFESLKSSTLESYKVDLFSTEIEYFRSRVNNLGRNKIQRGEKAKLLKEFKELRGKYSDFVKLQLKAFEVEKMIESIEVIGKSRTRSHYKGKNR
jgi:hypothetical protein